MKAGKGMKSVFDFTSKQYIRRNGFASLTILVALLLFLGVGALLFFSGKPKTAKDKEPEEIKKLGTVLLLNQTTLTDILPEEQPDEPVLWDYVSIEGEEEEAFKKAAEKEDHILAVVSVKEIEGKTTYVTSVKIPNNSKIERDEAIDAGDVISECVRTAVYRDVNMTEEMIAFIQLEPVARSITTDEDVSMLNMLIKSILPAILGLVMYMMILIHGQTICKEVAVEKTSKLMETMLVSVEPNALILGKTVSLTVLALGQFFIWVASAVGGMFGGHFLGKALYGDEYKNRILMAINFLRNNIGESALSPLAIVMSIVVFCFGVFIYFALAAMGGSFVSKPEETANAQGTFVFPMMICWIITYIASLGGAENVLRICRYIPFTAPFCVPIDVLTGTLGLVGGIIVCVEVTAVALLLIFLAARIYRGLMLHTGQKISLKVIWKVIRGR